MRNAHQRSRASARDAETPTKFPQEDRVLELQQRLADRYQELRNTRTGPVFFIEHGLAESELKDLLAKVRAAVKLYPIDSGWWVTHTLPLLVAATEVGYRYRGSGTDFWPVLEEELDVSIGAQARQRIKDLFATEARKFRGALPPTTPWAEAFHLISWPITHALVPIEFHRPLALTLARLRVNVAGLDDETLYRAIRIATASSSARFMTLLEDPNLLVPVIRSLLGEEITELCDETIKRIADDIAADNEARRHISAAKRIQQTLPKDGGDRTAQAEPTPSIKGTFHLRRMDEKFILEASFPRLEDEIASRLRRALRRRRYAPRLWGVTSPIPSEQLLSGLPFALKLMSPAADGAPLLPGVEQLEIDEDLRVILLALNLELAPPLVFAVGADNEVARLILGRSISGHRSYWVVTAAEQSLEGLSIAGDVGPYTCYALDPTDEVARQALEGLGFTIRFGISVAFSGAPTLDRDTSTPSFVIGDQRVVVPRRSSPEGMMVELDGRSTRVNGDDVVRIDVTTGEHLLQISSADETKVFPFKGVSARQVSPVVACSLRVCSTDLTVQALLSGRLTFSVDSFAPLEGLELTVEIEVSGRRLSASAPLGPLPQIISSELEPFASLLDDATRELTMQASSVTVRLCIGCLCARSWVLEHRVQGCWWSRRPDGRMTLMSELGELPFGEVTASAPHLPPDPELPASPLETRLLAPVDLSLSDFGGSALFSTYCVSPPRGPLALPHIPKPWLVRRRRAERSAAGLEDLVESYLRWSLADTDTLIAELRRRQVANQLDGWIAELCCGEAWALNESQLNVGDAWEILVNICDETGLCRDSYVHLSEKDDHELARLAVAEIRRELPEIFARLGPPCDLGDEDYEALDFACGRAYVRLADEYRARGMEDLADEIADGDPGAPSDDWNSVLERAKAHVEMPSLAALLVPSDTALRLMSVDPSMMNLEEMVDELIGWSREARRAFAGGVPAANTIKAIIALWTEPEIAVNLDWRGGLDTMIAERSVSRAARYLALRSRQAKLGGVK